MAFLLNIKNAYSQNNWFQNIIEYIDVRYFSIEKRLTESFEFVSPKTDNKNTHSFHFSSILREVGSVFDSGIREIISNANTGHNDNIVGFLNFLESFDRNLELISIDLLLNRKTIYPFLKSPTGIPEWWHSYNRVKHNEVTHYSLGNLENALKSVAALKILHLAISGSQSSDIFINVGQYTLHENAEVMF